MGNCKSCGGSVKIETAKSRVSPANGKMLLNNFGRCPKCLFLSSAICLILCYFYFVFVKFIPGHKMVEIFLLNFIALFLLLFLIHVVSFFLRKIPNK